MALDPWTPVDDPAQRVRKAVPGARITSERRTPERNAAVGGAPNSAHLKGFATDFILPAGSNPASVEAALRKQGKFDQIIYEGDHVHYSDDPRSRGQVFGAKGAKAPDPWTPVQADPWTPVTAPPISKPSGGASPSTPAQPPQPVPSSASGGWDPIQTVKSEITGAAHTLAEDVRQDVSYNEQRRRDLGKKPLGEEAAGFARTFIHPTEPGGVLRAGKEMSDAWAVVSSPLTGAFRAGVAKPVAELESHIPTPPGRTPETKQQIEDRTMTAMLGLGARGGLKAPVGGSSVEAALPKAKPSTAPVGPHGSVVGSEADPAERVDNALYRKGGHDTVDKIEALQALKAAPKAVKDPKVQEELTHEIEKKMINPDHQIPEHLKEAEAVRAPWAERQRLAINRVRQHLASKGMTDEEITEYLPDSGYVPRRVAGKSPAFDQSEGARNPLGFGRAGLSKTTGSLKARDQIVLEDAEGNRRFEHRNKTNDEWKPGMQVRDPLTGKPVTVKQATIREIEGAGARDSKGQPLTYHKNALANTIDEALKVERVERNLQVLDELTNHLKDQGLAHRDEWRFKGEDGMMNVVRANTPRPEGFVELPQIPQLRGYSFDPKIAEVLKDYYPGPKEPLDNIIATVNRALNASLFVTPFPHIKNVATMGFIGRGWDWIPIATNYGRLMKTANTAIREVLTLGPRYRKFLREGAGLMAGDDATRNFHQQLLQSAASGIAKDPKIAAATGLNPVELAKALYGVSHKILWNVNDMVLFQRQLELEAKGMSSRQAIKEAERWIANYRIPSRVLNQRWASNLLSDGKWINFGRYTYGKWRAIGEMIRGMTSKDPAQRKDAMGKVVAMGVVGLILYPLMDKMLQTVTGNPKAKVGRGGELAPIDAMADVASGEKDWVAGMGSVLTPAPLVEAAGEVYTDKDEFGRYIVDPQATPLGQTVQLGEAAADKIYPLSLLDQALKPGGAEQAGGRLLGVNIPPEASQAGKLKAKKFSRSRARARERKDPIEQMIRGAQ